MRRTAEHNGFTVKGYSGTTGILLAFNIEDNRRAGLLGFAIQREILSGRRKGEIAWLQGILDFEGTSKKKGELVATNVAPIQKFRWSDYTVYRSTRYAYRVFGVYKRGNQRVTAQNRRTFLIEGPRLEIDTQGFDAEDAIIFNRAVASSQAFSRRFPDLDEEIEQARQSGTLGTKSLPQRALNWLSRGLVEQMEAFLKQAEDSSWYVDIAIYEYHLPRLHEAVVAAGQRGANVRILYHAKTGDHAAEENEHLLNHPTVPGASLFPRKTTKLMHNKFVVLGRIDAAGDRKPKQVLAGSTNWTENGCYRQANVVHMTKAKSVLSQYQSMFEALIGTKDDRGATKRWINKNNELPVSPERFAGFSPRSGFVDIAEFADLVKDAKRDVMFSTAFQIRPEILDALEGDPNDDILRMGIQNTRSGITGTHRDRTAQFSAAALLPSGLEGWLKETSAKQRGSIRIHTKTILIDATSDTPMLISGSHNLSKSASDGNDENYMMIRRDLDVADVYLCEIMRIYDHYRFRFAAKERKAAGNPTDPPKLVGDDSWTDPYFADGDLKMMDRLRFAGV